MEGQQEDPFVFEGRQFISRTEVQRLSCRGSGKWEIDHIRPVNDFKKDELHLMNLISNLQPLWSEENNFKRAKLISC